MKCGHTANAETSDGKPVCIICFGITPDAEVIVPEENKPDLSGRSAVCLECGSVTDSNFKLPFFRASCH